MEKSWRKPEAKMVSPKRLDPHSQQAEAERENQEYLEQKAKIDAAQKEREDKVGALLGAKWFITNWTDPILTNGNMQFTVDRFYPEIAVALDIFMYIGDNEKRTIDFKRKAFKDSMASYGGQPIKVRYAALDYTMPLANVIPQLEA